jgi:diguanylate cyclase (GGDEF)-like protein
MGNQRLGIIFKGFRRLLQDLGGETSKAIATAVATAVVALAIAKAAWFGRLPGASHSLSNWSILGLCFLFAPIGAGLAVLALNQKIDRLKAALVREEDRASRDPLTRLYNQGYVKRILEKRLLDIAGKQETFSVILVDIDDFKLVNNQFGHEAGNYILGQIADTLSSSARAADDIVCRFGGDEFLVITKTRKSEVDPRGYGIPRVDEGYGFAERLRRQFEDGELIVEDNSSRRASITVGCGATTMIEGDTPESLLKRVSLALRKAKEPRISPEGLVQHKNVVFLLKTESFGS